MNNTESYIVDVEIR